CLAIPGQTPPVRQRHRNETYAWTCVLLLCEMPSADGASVNAQQWLLGSRLRQEGQGGQRDQEAIRARANLEPECNAECPPRLAGSRRCLARPEPSRASDRWRPVQDPAT